MSTRLCVIGVLICGLGGCATLDSLNPWAKKDLPPPPAVAAPVEKIGPDVIAVPVEPVVQENMLPAAASPKP